MHCDHDNDCEYIIDKHHIFDHNDEHVIHDDDERTGNVDNRVAALYDACSDFLNYGGQFRAVYDAAAAILNHDDDKSGYVLVRRDDLDNLDAAINADYYHRRSADVHHAARRLVDNARPDDAAADPAGDRVPGPAGDTARRLRTLIDDHVCAEALYSADNGVYRPELDSRRAAAHAALVAALRTPRDRDR